MILMYKNNQKKESMKLIMNSPMLRRLDSNECPSADGYEPNEHYKKESMKLIMNSPMLRNSLERTSVS